MGNILTNALVVLGGELQFVFQKELLLGNVPAASLPSSPNSEMAHEHPPSPALSPVAWHDLSLLVSPSANLVVGVETAEGGAMSRVIKLRGWTGHRMDYDCRDVTVWNGLLVPEGDTIIMLSTGLLDATGREIYEGDIVRLGEGILRVEYQAPSFIMKRPRRKTWHEFILAPPQNQFCTILGNWYEQPKLVR